MSDAVIAGLDPAISSFEEDGYAGPCAKTRFAL
jgi:hypothetical protein